MKAFLLAAGEGTRLQPLTFHTPKCLIPICGKPLIEYWFDIFEAYGVDEVLINTSYLADKVNSYVNNSKRTLKIHLTYEEKLLGSGGTIKKNWDFVKGQEAFFIFYADNLTNINLKKMMIFHNDHEKDITLAVFQVSTPEECGIIQFDEQSTIISFIEKPENPVSDIAFAGIILSTTKLIDYFPDQQVFDLGHHVLPRVIGRASAYIIDKYLMDIGTPEKLDQAEQDIKSGKFLNLN